MRSSLPHDVKPPVSGLTGALVFHYSELAVNCSKSRHDVHSLPHPFLLVPCSEGLHDFHDPCEKKHMWACYTPCIPVLWLPLTSNKVLISHGTCSKRENSTKSNYYLLKFIFLQQIFNLNDFVNILLSTFEGRKNPQENNIRSFVRGKKL